MRHRLRAFAFFNRWEKPLLYLAVACVTALLVSQALLLHDSTRRYLSWVDKIEGETVALQMPGGDELSGGYGANAPVAITVNPQRRQKLIIIKALKPACPAGVCVTVNGEQAADLGRGDAKLTVLEGDYLAIDATCLAEQAMFSVSVPEGGVESPADGKVLTGQAAIIAVGKVKFKH